MRTSSRQMLCARVGAELRVIPLTPDGTLQLDAIPPLFDERTRLLAITRFPTYWGRRTRWRP